MIIYPKPYSIYLRGTIDGSHKGRLFWLLYKLGGESQSLTAKRVAA